MKHLLTEFEMNNAHVKILVMTQNTVITRKIDELLKRAGLKYSLLGSDHLEDLDKSTATSAVDIILIDDKFLSGDRFSVIQNIISLFRNLPVILLSEQEGDTSYAALRVGLQDVVNPDKISPESLHRLIRYALERKKYLNLLTRYSMALETIRSINQLITTVDSENDLLSKACEILALNLNYLKAFIIRFSPDDIKQFFQYGFAREESESLLKELKADNLPVCLIEARRQKQHQIITEVNGKCKGCYLHSLCLEHTMIVVPLQFQQEFYGLTAIITTRNYQPEKEEIDTLIEGCNDLAFALYRFSLEQKRRETERKIQESELWFKTLFNKVGDAILVTEGATPSEATVVEANERALFLFQGKREELLGRTFRSLFPPEDWQKLLTQANLNPEGFVPELETRIQDFQGKLQPVELFQQRLMLTNKTHLLSIVRDLREKRYYENQLLSVHQIYRDAIENAGGVPYFFYYDATGYEYMGSRCRELLGVSAKEFNFDTMRTLVKDIMIAGHDEPVNVAGFIEDFKQGKLQQFSAYYRIITPAGEEKWISDHSTPVKDPQGKVIGSIGILQDISPLILERNRSYQLYRNQETLNRLSIALQEAEDLETLYNLLYKEMNDYFPVKSFMIFQYLQQEHSVFPVYVVSSGKKVELTQRWEFSINQEKDGDFHQTITTGRIHFVSDAANLTAPTHQYLNAILHGKTSKGKIKNHLSKKAILFIPLLIGKKPSGLILALYLKPPPFTDIDQEFFSGVGNITGISIQNTRLYSSLKKELENRIITEKKLRKIVQEKEVLLREVHHRVKNNMQLLISLISLERLQSEKKGIALHHLNKLQSRIMSMSLVHEMLYAEKNLSSLDLKGYLTSLVSMLQQVLSAKAGQIEVKISCDRIDIGLEKGIPIGLLLNEIISNSFKHAFKRKRKGTVNVDVKRINKKRIKIVVGDDGSGFPADIDYYHPSSTGMKMINIIARDQLQGELKINSSSRGTTYEIIIEV